MFGHRIGTHITRIRVIGNERVKLYELDAGDTETRALHKSTDAHVVKDKIKKMKVKNAVQVFSHSVSSIMALVIKAGNKSCKII